MSTYEQTVQSHIKVEPMDSVEDDLDDEEVIIVYDSSSIKPFVSSLLSMFPNIDSGYIKTICDNPPFQSNENDRFQMLVNYFLAHNDQMNNNVSNVPENSERSSTSGQIFDRQDSVTSDGILTEILQQQDQQTMEIERQNEERTNEFLFSEFLKQEQEVVDQKMNILEEVLPDADPNFLKKFIQENHENAMSLEQFVESSLINKNYEKRDKHYAKMKTTEKIKQYTTGFTVEEFVKQFPEPFEHFENVEKQGTFQDDAFNFLKKRYPNLPEQHLKHIYSTNNHNLSLTDKQIKADTGFEARIQGNIEVEITTLLQEIAFIQNKSSIKSYLDRVKREEETELQMLRAEKLLLECQCCYDELKPTECVECDNSHIFCNRCVIKGTHLVIANGQTSVRCFMGCDKEINLSVLRKVLPEYTFEMLLKKRQEAEVEAAQLDGLVTCPFCPFQMELAPQITIFTCKNPECMKITCRLCRKINHLPIKCEDVLDEHKGRLYIEEEMSKALIRNCHRCQKPFVKTTGCNMMTCLCGATMCYICRQPYTRGFSHINCGRHPNSRVFDKKQIESKRAAATEKLRRDFPDMKIPKV